jgi:hypothetical protein
VSTADPAARHARKSSSVLRGYRAHVAADPETGIITDKKLTMATGDENADADVAAQMAADEPGHEEGPATWYGDSAYGTGELRATGRSSSPDRCARPSRGASPSTTTPSTSRPRR